MKILIAPYAKKLRGQDRSNPKDYPWSKELVSLLEQEGHEVIQVGCSGEEQIAKTVINDLKFQDVLKLIAGADTFIAVDSYLQHAAWFIGKKGIVLWGQSDPKVFGHSIHKNLIKSRKNLRQGYKMFDWWESAETNPEVFVKPAKVILTLRKMINGQYDMGKSTARTS